jgi:dihydrofolate reductase
MRKIVTGLCVSLDGVVEAPETWTGPHLTDEISQQIRSMTPMGGTVLLGRLTYEALAASYSGRRGGEADRMNNTPKIVVSTTLTTANWQHTTLIRTNVVREIIRLKHQPGTTITVAGGPDLVRSLLYTRLLDELNLMIFPVVLGAAPDCSPATARARATPSHSGSSGPEPTVPAC